MRKLYFSLLAVVIIAAAPASAQVFYEKTAGYNGGITSMFNTMDGGYAVCGNSEVDSGNIVVARYSSAGSRLWMKELGTSTAEYAHDITQTTDGGYVVTGKRGYWQFKMLVIKIDSVGNMLWTKEFNNTNFDRANGVCATTDGGVVIAGRSYDGLSTTAVAFKLSATGTQLWSRSISGFDDGGYSIIRSSDGKFVMSGMTSQGASSNIGVVKFDSAGVYWAASIGGASQEFTGFNHQVVQTQDGGYVIGGNTALQNGDYYISKLSSSGAFLWSRSFGTSATENSGGIVASGNDVFVVGYMQSGSFPSVFYSPGLLKLDGAGNLLWSYQYGTASSIIPGAVTLLPSGYLIEGGRFSTGAYAGEAALSNFDMTGNACKQHSVFGNTTGFTNYYPMTVSSGAATLFSSSISLNLNTGGAESISCTCGSGAPFTISSSTSSICYGSTAVISYPYQAGFWYSLYRNGSFVSSTNSSYFSTLQGGNYFVVQNSGCGVDTSNTVHLSLNTLPAVSLTVSGRTKICQGQTVNLQANSSLGLTYEWLKNGGVISGAVLPSFAAAQTGSYAVRVTSTGTGCSKTSGSVNVTVNPLPPASATANGPTTFCNGDSVVLQANNGNGYTHQWRLNGVSIPGASSVNYTAKSAGVYKVRVRDTNGCTQLSSGVTVSVPCRESALNRQLVTLYPNPAITEINISCEGVGSVLYSLSDQTGRVLKSGIWIQGDAAIYIGDISPGVFFMETTTDNERNLQRIVIVR